MFTREYVHLNVILIFLHKIMGLGFDRILLVLVFLRYRAAFCCIK